MIEFGLIDEVKALYARKDLNADMSSMRIVGYRQVWQHLDGELDERALLEKAIVATRQLAKRQLTWLRSETELAWFDTLNADFETKVLSFLLDDPIFSLRV